MYVFKIEFILRRLPFGRVYAIRREMDGQCLGLIRDGNTATIVDVVPKSLSARHGLPPKVSVNFLFERIFIIHVLILLRHNPATVSRSPSGC